MDILTQDQYDILLARLSRTEGRRNKPYVDTVGKITIGIGHNLTDLGISDDILNALFKEDISRAASGAAELAIYNNLDPVRQTVLIDMVFNMGLGDIQHFVNMLYWIKQSNFDMAATQMLSSQWARQVGSRANELAEIMRTGNVVRR